MAETTCGKHCPLTLLRIKQMAEPSMVLPLAIAGAGGGVAIATGVDNNAVVAAFAGALMFCFFSAGTHLAVRAGLAVGAWVFGYYMGLEIVKRGIFGFDSPPVPSFMVAFFGVAVLKLLLAVFNEDGKTWIRKQLGLKPEGPKDE